MVFLDINNDFPDYRVYVDRKKVMFFISFVYFNKQGDAVFWYNLKKNGIGNPRTRHAACPVLVGTKWGKILLFVLASGLSRRSLFSWAIRIFFNLMLHPWTFIRFTPSPLQH